MSLRQYLLGGNQTNNEVKRFFITVCLLVLVLGSLFAQNKKYVVGFYNVENLFDIYDDPNKNDDDFTPEGNYNWDKDKYNKKINNIAQVLKAIKKETGAYHAVLGLAEIENESVLKDLVSAKDVASAGYKIVHYESPDRRGIDVALLYRPDCFKYLDSEALPFTFAPGSVNVPLSVEEKNNFRTRDALMVHGTIDGEQFAFYVAHLPSRVGDKAPALRSRGAEIIYRHALGMMKKYPGIKIVVMGDMNDNPTDESMTKWLHGRESISKVGKEDFFSPFTAVLESGTGSLSYKGDWNIYDIILTNYNLTNAPQGGLCLLQLGNGFYGKVFNKAFITQQSGQYKGTPFRTFSHGAFIGGYSDHYPTYVIIGKKEVESF